MGMDRWVTLHNVLPKVGSLYNVLFDILSVVVYLR